MIVFLKTLNHLGWIFTFLGLIVIYLIIMIVLNCPDHFQKISWFTFMMQLVLWRFIVK